MLDITNRELSQLGTTNVEKNNIFAQYVELQQRKAIAAEKAKELRDWQQTLKEWEQCLKKMKCEDKILKMNIVKLCAKNRARCGPLQEEIRS